MDEAFDHDERTAELLRLLPPAPEAWVVAAKELAPARAALDSLVARAEADARERARILAGLEEALAAEGVEPHGPVIDELRRRLDV